jgi:hypothetical protein
VNPFFADTTQKIQQAQQQKLSDIANGAASSSSGDPNGYERFVNKAVKWDDVMFPPHHVFNTTPPCVTRPLTASTIMNNDDDEDDNAKQTSRFTFDGPIASSAEMLISNEFTLAADEKFQLGNSLQSTSSSSLSSIINPVSVVSSPLEVYCEAAKLCNMSRKDAVEYLSAVMASSSPSVPAATATTVTATTTTPVSTYPATSMTLCDKYRPKQLSQYHCKINNIPGSIFSKQSSILHFHTWLSEWKVNNINNLTSTSAWNNSKASSSSSSKHAFWFEDDEEEDEDVYSNTCLIHGPSGVGKSSSVYSCADELGFNVIEVIYNTHTFMIVCTCL